MEFSVQTFTQMSTVHVNIVEQIETAALSKTVICFSIDCNGGRISSTVLLKWASEIANGMSHLETKNVTFKTIPRF